MAVVIALLVAGIFAAAMLLRDIRRDQQISQLLSLAAAERSAWAKERWELNTRIQSPALIADNPLPSPGAIAVAAFEDEVEPDESHLIGLVDG